LWIWTEVTQNGEAANHAATQASRTRDHRCVDNDDIAKRRANRLRVLNFIYEAAEGSRRININGPWLLEHVGMPQEELEDACMYLVAEQLIEGDKTLWSSYIPYTTRLTHRGLVEMERSRSDPQKPTSYFPPMVSVYIAGDNIGSPIQAGSPGASQITTIGSIVDQAREIVRAYRDQADQIGRELGRDDADTLQAEIATVETQLGSPHPNEGAIRESLRSARRILSENATTGAVAGGILLELLQHIRF
jgi:hypothetical protein